MERARVRLERARRRRRSPLLAEFIAVPDRAFDGAALLVSLPQGSSIDAVSEALVKAGAIGALLGPRRQPRNPLYGCRREVRPVDRRPDQDGPRRVARRSIERIEHDMSHRPQPRPGVLDIEPYVPGKSTAPGVAKVFKLSSNETPLGPSPKAVAAYQRGERASRGLSGRRGHRAARGDRRSAFGLDPARIVCGAGSDDLLNLLARAYLADGDEAIHTTHGFLVYPIATLGRGAKPVVAPEKNYTADVDAILAAVTPKTKIVFLANPNNPTGTYLPFDEVKRLHAGLPPHVLLVLDAAYAEYVDRNDYESGIELVATSENVVMCRTFSKIYGLAALRLGWMYGPAHVVDAVNRIRGPFNVNAPAIAAGVAAIRDTAHVERARAHNTTVARLAHRRRSASSA